MEHPDMSGGRLTAHSAVSTALALCSDRGLRELVDAAVPLGSGIGGRSALMEVAGTPVLGGRGRRSDADPRRGNRRNGTHIAWFRWPITRGYQLILERHAVAMDERRSPYTPALWSEPYAPGQDVKQVWFPGSHKDVGGGHLQKGLSDGALRWMIDEARDAVKIGFHMTTVEDQIEPNPLDVMHDDERGVVGVLEPLVDSALKPMLEPIIQPRPRAVPRIDPNAPSHLLHNSVYVRYKNPPITSGPYLVSSGLTSASPSVPARAAG